MARRRTTRAARRAEKAREEAPRRLSLAPLVREPHPGAPPGTLMLEGGERPRIFVMDYCETTYEEKEIQSVDEVKSYLVDDRASVTWVDVRGLGDKPTFERIGEVFGIHPLALEDVVNAPQRPKADVYPS